MQVYQQYILQSIQSSPRSWNLSPHGGKTGNEEWLTLELTVFWKMRKMSRFVRNPDGVGVKCKIIKPHPTPIIFSEWSLLTYSDTLLCKRSQFKCQLTNIHWCSLYYVSILIIVCILQTVIPWRPGCCYEDGGRPSFARRPAWSCQGLITPGPPVGSFHQTHHMPDHATSVC